MNKPVLIPSHILEIIIRKDMIKDIQWSRINI